MRVQLLYFKSCPNSGTAKEILQGVLSEEAPEIEVETVDVERDPLPESGAPGSPTILVDGRDLFPAGRSAGSSNCRVYATPEGLKGHPTSDMVRDALRGLLTETR